MTDPESNADHSWRLAMMVVMLEKHLSQPLDFRKAIIMALIHDIPEIIAGDPSPLGSDGTGNDSHAYNKEAARKKFENEDKAAKEIFGKLPKEEGDELYAIWREFEDHSTFEAKVVVALDKWEGKLQSFEYSSGEFTKTHYDFTIKYGVEYFAEADPAIEELGKILLKELKDNYKEYKGPGK